MVQQLVDPPQGIDYIPIMADRFPKEYPLVAKKEGDVEMDGYFYKKFYMSQRQFFSLPKK
jgi:hypothetical protein